MIDRARFTALRQRFAKGLLVAVAALAAWSCSDASFVEGITIVNDTDYPVNLSVTGDGQEGWLFVATSKERSTHEVDRVIDQGERWVFRWDYGGAHAEAEITRTELERSDWRVEVPQSLEDALREMDLPPP
jgi:hypothetical protein